MKLSVTNETTKRINERWLSLEKENMINPLTYVKVSPHINV